MPNRYISRQSGFRGAQGLPGAAPFIIDSGDSNKIKTIPAGSGTTAVEIVDASSIQTLTNKTMTSPTLNTPTIVSPTWTGDSVPVTASGGATRLLTAANSGSINLFDVATGIVYTLPASPTVGLYYYFYVTVLQTSGANTIIANATPSSTFLIGSVTTFSGEAVTPAVNLGPYIHNSPLASSFVKLSTNGTTTGGGAGSWFCFVCVGATSWFVTGVNHSPSGNLATPFSV